MFSLGDTFRVTDPGSTLDRHLWIVLSNPEADPEAILIVNMTSWGTQKDPACVLGAGDHPFLSHKSCVNYRDAKVLSAARLEALLSAKHIAKQPPLSKDVLARVLCGAATSRFIALDHAKLLADQGLIEL
jgi:hypothetical protein